MPVSTGFSPSREAYNVNICNRPGKTGCSAIAKCKTGIPVGGGFRVSFDGEVDEYPPIDGLEFSVQSSFATADGWRVEAIASATDEDEDRDIVLRAFAYCSDQ